MSEADAPSEGPIRIAISACILGQEVRYNGGHKLSRYLRDTLGSYVEFLPLCPEMEIGMGVPRETVRLEGDPHDPESYPRMVAPKSGTDYTEAMRAYATAKAQDLARAKIHGAILQKGSPSCGMERVKVYPESGMPRKSGRGLFARALMEELPYLPVEEDGRMNDPRLRENFIERIFAFRRIREFFSNPWSMGDLVRFHTREKMQLMAHDRPTYTALGRIVAHAKGRPKDQVAQEYESIYMTGLKKMATVRKVTNVLQHMAGHLKKILDAEDKAELHDTIERYHQGEVPLVVPLTLLRHHVRKHKVEYLEGQTFLEPHPRELSLRNHV